MNSNRPDLEQPRPRSHAKWVCGYQSVGLPCADGPDEQGNCCQIVRAKAAKETVRLCSQSCACAEVCELAAVRDEPVLASHVDLGPCVPQRSHRFSRQVLALNAAIFTGGILLLCMAFPTRESVFVPGPLSAKHGQILGNKLVSERCSLCHPSSHGVRGTGVTQDELCLRCHDAHMPDASLGNPHDLHFDAITAISSSSQSYSLGPQLATTSALNSTAIKQTRCAMCHVEHHGQSHDLAHMSDSRCQTCHQVQFASLSAGHPQFNDYPSRSRSTIAFNHGAHASEHFAKKNESFDCRKCHVSVEDRSSVGAVFRTLGFEQACAACHDEPLRSSSVNGWAVLQLPSIEPDDAVAGSRELENWPSGARYGYDGQLSIAMQLLLAADPAVESTVWTLPASGQISELPGPATGLETINPRAVAARNLAIATRRLISDVARDGQAAWRQRLMEVLKKQAQREPTAYEVELVDRICRGLPPDLFRSMESAWFRSSADTVATNMARPNQAPPTTARSTTAPPTQLGEFRLVGNLQERADDLLSQSALQTDLGDLSFDGLSSDDAEDLLLGDSENSSGDELLDADLGATGSQPEQQRLTKLRGSEHVGQGGWFLDSELYALRYVPRGHADETLAAWIEFAAVVAELKRERDANGNTATDGPLESHGGLLQAASRELMACQECHLLRGPDATASLASLARWKAVSRPKNAKPFTKFDHTPHLSLPAVNDCRYCHVQSGEAVATPLVSSRSVGTASVERCDFEPMRIEQCVSCHRPSGASDGCTVCHNYHVGQIGLTWSEARGER